MSENNRLLDRRELIKTAGAAFATSGVAGVASARRSRQHHSERVFEEARAVRRKTGSQEEFIKYLEENGANVSVAQSTVTPGTQHQDHGNDTVSAQKVSEDNITTTLTVEYMRPYNPIQIDYHVDIAGGYKTGEENDDHLSISWPSDHFELSETYIDNGDNVRLVESGFDGAHWAFDDHWACGNYCDLWFAVGCQAHHEYSVDNPKAQATYQSVYSSDTQIDGFSVDADGTVSFSVSGGYDYEQIDRKVTRLDDGY